MGTYHKGRSPYCDLCGRYFNALIPYETRGASRQAAVYEATQILEQHRKTHSTPLADIYPKGTQQCVTCHALIADRDIGSHFQWHNKKGN